MRQKNIDLLIHYRLIFINRLFVSNLNLKIYNGHNLANHYFSTSFIFIIKHMEAFIQKIVVRNLRPKVDETGSI